MKKAIFTLQNGGGSYKVKIIGSKRNWIKIDGEIIFDTNLRAIIKDLKGDNYKIIKICNR